MKTRPAKNHFRLMNFAYLDVFVFHSRRGGGFLLHLFELHTSTPWLRPTRASHTQENIGSSEMKTSFKFSSLSPCTKDDQVQVGTKCAGSEFIYSEGQSMVPSLMPSMTSWGSIPSTVQPTDWAVPRTSFIVPENSLAMDRGAITRAAAMMSSIVMLPLCWMFFTFFRSLGGSFSALMTRAAAEGTTEQVACLKVNCQEKLSVTFISSTS